LKGIVEPAAREIK